MCDRTAFWDVNERQLEPGPYRARIEAFHTPQMQLALSSRSRSTWVGGRAPAGSVVFCVALPSPDPRYFSYRPFLPKQVGVIRAGEELNLQLINESQILTVAVDAHLADQATHQFLNVPLEDVGRDSIVHLRSAKTGATLGTRLRHFLREAMANAAALTERTAARDFETLVLKTLLAELDCATPILNPPLRRQLALAADEYLQHRVDQPLDLPALCEKIGGSARTVQIAYRETFGLSLKSALQALRFNGARRDLRNSRGHRVLVKEIALKWGFMHYGRFSVKYRGWFGEEPSTTLGIDRTPIKRPPFQANRSPRLAFPPVSTFMVCPGAHPQTSLVPAGR